MKPLPASLFAILLTAVATPCLHAQEAAPAAPAAPEQAPARLSLQPGAPPAKTESLLPEDKGGLPLIPESIPPANKPDTGAPDFREPKEKKSRASAAEDALRDQIKLRTAKSKAKEDPELQALWDSHYGARTDYEQRKILTRYYTLLCERIAKIDKTIKPEAIDALRVSYFNDYNQNHIQPTEQPKGYVDPWPEKPAAKAKPKPKR